MGPRCPSCALPVPQHRPLSWCSSQCSTAWTILRRGATSTGCFGPPLLYSCPSHLVIVFPVLNGLDNLEARRHVNRLCMAAQRPLIESGTAGYLGQCTVHLKGRTECFECTPKVAPKSFPICTLRNTCVGGLWCLGLGCWRGFDTWGLRCLRAGMDMHGRRGTKLARRWSGQ